MRKTKLKHYHAKFQKVSQRSGLIRVWNIFDQSWKAWIFLPTLWSITFAIFYASNKCFNASALKIVMVIYTFISSNLAKNLLKLCTTQWKCLQCTHIQYCRTDSIFSPYMLRFHSRILFEVQRTKCKNELGGSIIRKVFHDMTGTTLIWQLWGSLSNRMSAIFALRQKRKVSVIVFLFQLR